MVSHLLNLVPSAAVGATRAVFPKNVEVAKESAQEASRAAAANLLLLIVAYIYVATIVAGGFARVWAGSWTGSWAATVALFARQSKGRRSEKSKKRNSELHDGDCEEKKLE